MLLFPPQRGGVGARRMTGCAPVPVGGCSARVAVRGVIGHIDLDPLFLDRSEDFADVSLPYRMLEIRGEGVVVHDVDHERVRESVVYLASTTSKRDPFDAVDPADELLRLGKGTVYLRVRGPGLPLEQHDVLDHVSYFSMSRAADVHAVVTSRMNFACVVARLEIQSMSLLPGPRSTALAIALSAFS
jgi:hypothetical protein